MGNRYKSSDTGRSDSRPNQGSRKPNGFGGGSGSGSGQRERQDCPVFVSHSWNYDQEYARLVRLLQQSDEYDFRNYSVPRDEAFEDKSDKELERVIREKQIQPASVVIVLAGVYSTHSKWIGKEIRIAKQEGKPILGVRPWGNRRTSRYVKRNADQMVNWNTDSIVEGIRDLIE